MIDCYPVSIFEAGATMVCPGPGRNPRLPCNRALGKVGYGLIVALRISPTGEPVKGTTTHRCHSCKSVIEATQVAA